MPFPVSGEEAAYSVMTEGPVAAGAVCGSTGVMNDGVRDSTPVRGRDVWSGETGFVVDGGAVYEGSVGVTYRGWPTAPVDESEAPPQGTAAQPPRS